MAIRWQVWQLAFLCTKDPLRFMYRRRYDYNSRLNILPSVYRSLVLATSMTAAMTPNVILTSYTTVVRVGPCICIDAEQSMERLGSGNDGS
jgi:hypothetical protein